MLNYEFSPQSKQADTHSGRVIEYEARLVDRKCKAEQTVQDFLNKFGPGISLADLGELGQEIEARLQAVLLEDSEGESLIKLARLVKAVNNAANLNETRH